MSNTIDLDDLMSSKEVATLLGLKTNTLEIYRHQGKGPPFVKLGDQPQSPVRYRRSAVLAWAAQQTFKSTSAHTAAVKAKRPAGVTITPGAIPGPWERPAQGSSQPRGASE